MQKNKNVYQAFSHQLLKITAWRGEKLQLIITNPKITLDNNDGKNETKPLV
jgi:hypothetical protein